MTVRFSLWRILGNDLPPRHRPGQTCENLRFILDHEPRLTGCARRWIVNRIVDPRAEARVLAILDRHGESYLRIPFRLGEYRRAVARDTRTRVVPAGPATRADRLRHLKCLYVMNLNAARNVAIDRGRRTADWILPLDGNCCFTADGWERVLERVGRERDRTRCLAVPMYRLTRNRDYFSFSTAGRRAQEPQVIFGRDCPVRFDPWYRYGLEDKVELLKRVGFPSVRRGAYAVTGRDATCGYVTRLYSGVERGEAQWKPRARLRERGIDLLLRRVDRAAAAN